MHFITVGCDFSWNRHVASCHGGVRLVLMLLEELVVISDYILCKSSVISEYRGVISCLLSGVRQSLVLISCYRLI
jgi:hypothetical protein